MREHTFNKIKKTVFILLAVFLVISLTTTSASAWYSKTADGKCKEVAKEKVKEVAKPVKEVAKPVAEVEKPVAEVENPAFLCNNCFVTFWVKICYDCWDCCWDNCWNNCW